MPVATKITSELDKSVNKGGTEVHTSASIGISVYVLGHSGLQTTMRHARADFDLSRALAQVFPDVLRALKAGRVALTARN
jgi:hypothetical protein